LDKNEETDQFDSFTFEPAADLDNRDEFDLSGKSASTDDFLNREDRSDRESLDRTDQESNAEELGQTEPQENVTAATLSLDTDFALKSPTPEFALGPDDEFGFEFEGDFGDLGDPVPSTLDDKIPLTSNEISADFTTDQFELEESSFAFETAEETPSGSLDAFADIEFSEEAPADFETLEPELEENRSSESLDNFPDIDLTEKSTADAGDKESSKEPQPETSKYAGFTFDTPSFRAPADSPAKEEIQEDFAAAFDEIEPSLSSEALDDIAASILKDQESPPPITPETVPEIQPESVPAPQPPPAAKPATLFARCEGCNHKLAYKETLSGKRVRCPACSVAFKLP
ncbi:MAG: hypothetical protein IBX47_11940, partial [Desulfuromonadales bacterium]|nr:hypothetical protein [Desulfuromonadales bacterium]